MSNDFAMPLHCRSILLLVDRAHMLSGWRLRFDKVSPVYVEEAQKTGLNTRKDILKKRKSIRPVACQSFDNICVIRLLMSLSSGAR